MTAGAQVPVTAGTRPPAAAGAQGATAAGERGSVTLWLLGLCIVLLFVGGLGLDLWRAFSERRALAGVVDAAAVAGASGLDAAAFRETGELRLDPALAEELAAANLAAQTDVGALTGATVVATPAHVTVEAAGTVDLTLTRMLLDPAPLTIRVTATAEPHRSP